MLNWNNAEGVPHNILEGIERFVRQGIPPGNCLRAILENNLMEAFKRADHFTISAMQAIVSYIYNEVPMDASGSPVKVSEWIGHGGLGHATKEP